MLSVIVPYRDRAEHLAVFKPAVYKYLSENLDHDFEIIIVEQANDKPFNRAKLLNVGALLCNPTYAYLCFHDVDHIPENVNYSLPAHTTQLVKSEIQQKGYLGGVTLMPKTVFFNIDGFSNNFWGWGGEDNELRNRLSRHLVIERFGTWNLLPHEKAGTFDAKKWAQSQMPRKKNDGVYNTDYKVIKSVSEPEFNLHHFWVEI